MPQVPDTASMMKLRGRATHRKSRDGCSACKRAHRKCDVAKPTCGRCQKAKQPCTYELLPPIPKFRGVKLVTFDNAPSVTSSEDKDPDNVALQYFKRHTLPILQACRASLLWDYLLHHIKRQSQDADLRVICRAVGIQHQLADLHQAPDPQTVQAADVAYGEALHCLQTVLSTKRARTVAVLGCLLMCILETLRGPSQALLSHIYCGVRILQESDEVMTPELHDASQIVRHYAVGATLFNPLSDGARRIMTLLEEPLCKSSIPLTIADRQVQLALDMVQLMAYHGGKRTMVPSSIEELKTQQTDIEREVDDALVTLDMSDGKTLALLQLTKASSLALRMFLVAAWTELQLSYDLHLDDCRSIVALVRAALPAFNTLGSGAAKGSRSGPPAFSIGLFAQLTIMVVGTQCRDQDTRAAALALLDHCPRREGVCDATLIKDISRTIKYCEEQRAGPRGLDIPEGCRVHHHVLLQTDDDAKPAVLRVFFSPLSVDVPDYYDHELIRE